MRKNLDWIRSKLKRMGTPEKLGKEEASRIWNKIDDLQEKERLGTQVFRGEYVKALKDSKEMLKPIYSKNEEQDRSLFEWEIDRLIDMAKKGNIDPLFRMNFDAMKSILHNIMGNVRRDQTLAS